MTVQRSKIAMTAAAIIGGLVLSGLTRTQRKAALPPAGSDPWPEWLSWGMPIALGAFNFLAIWGEVHEPARRNPSGREAFRRMGAVAATGLNLLTAAFGRGPALRPAQALTLMQSAVAVIKDAGSKKRTDVRVVSILPLAAWFGYAVGFAIRSRIIDRR